MKAIIFLILLAGILLAAVFTNQKRSDNCVSMGGQVIETGIIKRSCVYPKGVK
jgi:hypothetical protein